MNPLSIEPGTAVDYGVQLARGLEPAGIALRPAAAGDEGFLLEVYASTRTEELATTGWSTAQMDAFLRMQHRAQDSHYRTHFPDASFEIVVAGGVPAGRLYVSRRPGELRILDLALLTEHRRRGIGSLLLRALQREAQRHAQRVILHVERYNRALELYRRLGFAAVAETGVHIRMAWPAQAMAHDTEAEVAP